MSKETNARHIAWVKVAQAILADQWGIKITKNVTCPCPRAAECPAFRHTYLPALCEVDDDRAVGIDPTMDSDAAARFLLLYHEDLRPVNRDWRAAMYGRDITQKAKGAGMYGESRAALNRARVKQRAAD